MYDRAQVTPWDRLDLEASGGFNLARGNSRTTSMRLDGGAVYSHDHGASTRLDLSTTINEQQNAEDTRRSTLDLSHKYWGSAGRLTFDSSIRLEENEVSKLDFRTIVAAALGYRIIKSPRNRLELFAGLAWVSEDFVGRSREENLDSILGFEYRLNFDRTRFGSVLVLFPSTDGRTLANLDGKLSIELVKKLDFRVTYYGRYDSNPPVATEEYDYGFTLGLGWAK